jgi:Predicted AAA-ATPase/PD-(D/E)XK nuclease superfamily
MKNLPVGIQSFEKLRNLNRVYVDKTRLINELVTVGDCYFLSRPRRFGKSLLVSTMAALFSGKKHLFEGLWIEDQWDWNQKFPIIHLSFAKIDHMEGGLKAALFEALRRVAKTYGLVLTATSCARQFSELIELLHDQHGPVVVLIDEYDKPIIDHIENSEVEKMEENRMILKSFFGILKDAGEYLRFLFLTGVSKFTKVSIFSDLNHLEDLTMHPDYTTLVGYTQAELEANFDAYLAKAQDRNQLSRQELLNKLKLWYNGYSWGGTEKLYNPFGILLFFSSCAFESHWFGSGTPNFLLKLINQRQDFRVEHTSSILHLLHGDDFRKINLAALLFQTGYFTIVGRNDDGTYELDYPNFEVREAMYLCLLYDLTQEDPSYLLNRIRRAFAANQLDDIYRFLNQMLANLPYETYTRSSEGLYHGLVHMVFNYLGLRIQSEAHHAQGRIDTLVQTLTHIYLFEFKFDGSAQEALTQIQTRGYANQFAGSPKTLVLIGVNFNKTTRQMDPWEIMSH